MWIGDVFPARCRAALLPTRPPEGAWRYGGSPFALFVRAMPSRKALFAAVSVHCHAVSISTPAVRSSSMAKCRASRS